MPTKQSKKISQSIKVFLEEWATVLAAIVFVPRMKTAPKQPKACRATSDKVEYQMC